MDEEKSKEQNELSPQEQLFGKGNFLDLPKPSLSLPHVSENSTTEKVGEPKKEMSEKSMANHSFRPPDVPVALFSEKTFPSGRKLPSGVEFAEFGDRVIAASIDGAIFMLVFLIVAVIVFSIYPVTIRQVSLTSLGWGGITPNVLDTAEFMRTLKRPLYLSMWIQQVFLLIYSVYLLCSPWQATVGKRIMGLYVTDNDGQPISILASSARYLLSYVGYYTIIGVLMVPFMERRQSIHDLVCQTLVLKKTKKS